MGQIGVSIYPSKSIMEKDKEYLQKASNLGFKRIFTSMLELTGKGEETLKKYKEIIIFGNKLGMKTTLDINPHLFEQLGVSYEDLSFFKDMGADAIRLDLGFTGSEEALMTKNPHQLKIEVNMSSGTNYIDSVMSYRPNKEYLIASHNFYPMTYSGLSREHFDQTTAQFNHYRLKTAAFVNSQYGELGPWPIQSGLCTLEEHRYLPLSVQVMHYKLIDEIDDLIIGNGYATDAELKQMADIFFDPHPTLPIRFTPETTDLEKKVILDELHSYRGDRSAYLIRSSMTRVKFKNEEFPAGRTSAIERGSVLIGNNSFGQYKGETQIALQPIKDEGTRNVVGMIPKDNLSLLDDLKPWSSFRFVEVE
jgi:hypothetical protein